VGWMCACRSLAREDVWRHRHLRRGRVWMYGTAIYVPVVAPAAAPAAARPAAPPPATATAPPATCRLHPLECNTTTCNLRHSLHPRGVKQYILTALESSLIFGVSAMEGGAAVSPECESAGARAKCLQSVLQSAIATGCKWHFSRSGTEGAHTPPASVTHVSDGYCVPRTADRGPPEAGHPRREAAAMPE